MSASTHVYGIAPYDTPEDGAHYVAHDDLGVLGLGRTPDEALEDARVAVGGDDLPVLSTARVSRALYRLIWESGWDHRRDRFEVVDGELRDTTPRRETYLMRWED